MIVHRGMCPKDFARAGLCALVMPFLMSDAAMAQSLPKWSPSIDFEAKPGTKRSLGEVDLFAPLLQNDTTLLFASVRARLDDDSSREGNLGLGLRHMLASGWNLGVYGYYDHRRTEFGHYFKQATFGFEMLGSDWDFRANAYLPFGDRVRDLGSMPGTGVSVASLVGTTIQVTTPGGLIREERALRGFDAEIGWRVPIWSADDTKALRLYAGMFHFDDDVVRSVTGPRLRAELTMYEVPGLWEGTRLTLGAEYQHDDVRGDQGFALVRLSVPLQPQRGAAKLTPQERRMTERVVRDVDIVTQARTAQTSPTIVETATQTAGGSAITVIDSATTSGAALFGEVTAAGANSTVILTGAFSTTNQIAVQTDQTLMGAGTLTVQTPSGHIASLTTPGASIATLGSTGVILFSGATLSGMTVSALNGFGVIAALPGTTIVNNTISVSGSGVSNSVGIVANIPNVVISNNVITVTQTGTGVARGIALGLATNALVSNNTVSVTNTGGSAAVGAFALNNTDVAAGSTGNVVTVTGGAVCEIAGGGNTGAIEYNGGTCP